MMSPDKYDPFVEAAKVATYYEHKLHNGERIASPILRLKPDGRKDSQNIMGKP